MDRSFSHPFFKAIFFGFFIAGILFLASCKSTEEVPEPYLLTANQHEKCMEVLREGLHSDEFWASIYAGEALVRNEYSFDVTPLFRERLAEEQDAQKRAAYASVLTRSGDTDALIELQDVLLTNDIEAQILAAQGMFRTASVADAQLLEEAMAEGNDGRLRMFAAAALALVEDANTVDFIRSNLSSEDPINRYTAADIIPVLGTAKKDTLSLLVQQKNEQSEFEQFFTDRALAIFRHNPSRKTLAGFLDHNDPTIRARAAYAMAEAWIVEESDRLYAMLNDPARAVRVRAAQALLILSNPMSPERYLELR